MKQRERLFRDHAASLVRAAVTAGADNAVQHFRNTRIGRMRARPGEHAAADLVRCGIEVLQLLPFVPGLAPLVGCEE